MVPGRPVGGERVGTRKVDILKAVKPLESPAGPAERACFFAAWLSRWLWSAAPEYVFTAKHAQSGKQGPVRSCGRRYREQPLGRGRSAPSAAAGVSRATRNSTAERTVLNTPHDNAVGYGCKTTDTHRLAQKSINTVPSVVGRQRFPFLPQTISGATTFRFCARRRSVQLKHEASERRVMF